MLRRFGYIFAVIVWLIIMCLPLMAFMLAYKGEMKLGEQAKSHIRLFMVQGDEEAGVGFEWSRKADDDAGCYKSSLRYLLWSGDAEEVNTDYCQCFRDIEDQVVYDGPCQ